MRSGKSIATDDEPRHDAATAERRLREAIDILPEGIVFLDAEGRYILWNQQYADIYRRSADLFRVGAKLEDTLRIGVARGDYPAAIGREEEWIAERLDLMSTPRERHEQVLADGRVILIEERRTSDGGTIGLRVDITDMKQREASFRLLFDSNPLPMFVCAVGRPEDPRGQRRRRRPLRLRPRNAGRGHARRHPRPRRGLRRSTPSPTRRRTGRRAAPGSTARPTAARSTSRSSRGGWSTTACRPC